MEQNKNEWEGIKDNAKELKGATGLVFGTLFWSLMFTIGIWAFVEAIFQVTLTFVQAGLITAGIFLIFIVKSWWKNADHK